MVIVDTTATCVQRDQMMPMFEKRWLRRGGNTLVTSTILQKTLSVKDARAKATRSPTSSVKRDLVPERKASIAALNATNSHVKK